MQRTPSTPITRPNTLSRPLPRAYGSHSGPVPRGQGSVSQPLPPPPGEVTTYRPRGVLVAAVLILPVGVFLAIFVTALIIGPTHPAARIVLGLTSLLVALWFVGLMLVAPIVLAQVQTPGDGLLFLPPYGKPRRIAWRYIDRAERRFGLLWLHSSDGIAVWCMESGLDQGARLLRQIILRLSPNVLDVPLRHQLALMGGVAMQEEASIFPINLEVGNSPIWFGVMVALGVTGAGLGIGASVASAYWISGLGGILLILGLTGVYLLRQRIRVDGRSITVIRPNGKTNAMLWSEIDIVEEIPPQIVLKLRGQGRQMRFLGTFTLSAIDREQLRGAFATHLKKGILLIPKAWL